jgi:hypothetical protein
VYNATRQVGPVLGSASMAAFMAWQLSLQMPPTFTDATRGAGGDARTGAALPEALRSPFAEAMSHSMLLPAFVSLFGAAGAMFLVGFQRQQLRQLAESGH